MFLSRLAPGFPVLQWPKCGCGKITLFPSGNQHNTKARHKSRTDRGQKETSLSLFGKPKCLSAAMFFPWATNETGRTHLDENRSHLSLFTVAHETFPGVFRHPQLCPRAIIDILPLVLPEGRRVSERSPGPLASSSTSPGHVGRRQWREVTTVHCPQGNMPSVSLCRGDPG
jgi:hypothetical protein